jgi:serine/threonine protein phosphatase PrpC
MVLAQAVSDAGPVRKNNEDSWAVEDDLQLYVVADGMGGHSAGEVASRLAVEALVGFIRRSHEETDVSWPYGIDPTLSLQANRLRTAINLANRRVFRAAESHDDYTGMGTTIVAALVAHDRLIVGSVGDSRLYLLSGGSLVQVTQDDTWAATMLAERGEKDPNALAHHPMRHVLTNVLGARDTTNVHISEHVLTAGDTVMLCSDGLYGAVDDPTLLTVMQESAELEAIAARLVKTAIEKGTRDNITALVMRYKAEA